MYTRVLDYAGSVSNEQIRRDVDDAFIPADPENRDWQAYQAWLADGNAPAEPPAPAAVVPGVISDRQFAQALAMAGTITQDEALAWAGPGVLPSTLSAALAQIPETGGQRFAAKMLLTSATTYERDHPLTGQLGALLGYDAAALDALWTGAAAL